MKLKSVSCTSNLLAQRCEFRKCTMFLQKWVLSPQDLPRSQSLERVPIYIVLQCFPHDNIIGIQLCEECKRSKAKRLSQTFVHFVTARASLFTDHKISGPPIRAKYRHLRTIYEQTVDNSPLTHFLLQNDGHPCMVLRLCKIVESFFSQVRNIYPHISLHDLPCHRTKKMLFLQQVSLKLWLVVFPWVQLKSWIRTYLCRLPQFHY